MKKKILLFICCLYFSVNNINSHTLDSSYQNAYDEISTMLIDQTSLDFKKAVLQTENAYLDGKFNFQLIDKRINMILALTNKIKELPQKK